MLSGNKLEKSFSHKFYMFTIFIAFTYLIVDSVKSGLRTSIIAGGTHPSDPYADLDGTDGQFGPYLHAETLSDILYRITII